MLLGSACSEVTESLAKVVPYWNILQVRFLNKYTVELVDNGNHLGQNKKEKQILQYYFDKFNSFRILSLTSFTVASTRTGNYSETRKLRKVEKEQRNLYKSGVKYMSKCVNQTFSSVFLPFFENRNVNVYL